MTHPPMSTNPAGSIFRDKWFWTIVLVALAIRAGLLGCALRDGLPLDSADTPTYTNPARSLLAVGTLSQDSEPPYRIDTLRTPGYPLLIAAVWALAGGQMQAPVAMVQVLLSTAAVGFVYAAGLLMIGRRGAIVAASLLAIEGLSAAMASYVLSDSLYQFCVGLWFYLLARFLRDRSWPTLVAASLTAGLALYVRPVGLLFPLVLAGLALWTTRGTWSGRLSRALAAVLIPAIVVFPWCLRNHLGADTWELTTIASRNMLIFRAAKVKAMVEGKDFYREARAELVAEAESRTPPDATPGERLRIGRKVAIDYMCSHPQATMRAHLQGAVVLLALPDRWSVPHLLGADEQGGILHSQAGWGDKIRQLWRQYHSVTLAYMIASGLMLVGLWIAALVGWFRAWRCGRRTEVAALIITLACLIAASVVPEAEPRLRIPLIVPLVLSAGLAFAARSALTDTTTARDGG
ncbi:MAG: glycosyltransferase family 39 protein [Planctomycetes bacterium]|nr:glycosyltransferase family 39 protein [Planctomycetota bacterium]